MDLEKNRMTAVGIAAERLGAVLQQERRLDEQLGILSCALDKLESVLGMVLLPPPGARKEEPRPAVAVPLAEHFAKHSDDLDHLIARLAEITERISI